MPAPCRSSGTWAIPFRRSRAGRSGPQCRARSSPWNSIRPVLGRAEPGEHVEQLGLAVAGNAGDAQDLAAPHGEILTVEPATPRASRRLRSSTDSTIGPGVAAARCGGSSLRPTISSAISAAEVWDVASWATALPARMTVTASVSAMISRSLWVTMITVLPSARRRRSVANRPSTSCRVSTAVGSSRIMISAPR